MSMHKIPLTPLEEAGLRNHRLPIGSPSQLADAFRHGMAWAISTPPAVPPGMALVPLKITEAMHVAGVRTIVRCTGNDDWPPRVWAAMLAASQPPAAMPVVAHAVAPTAVVDHETKNVSDNTQPVPATGAQPQGATLDDMNTLIGHAVGLRMQGQNDMPAYFFDLAARIAPDAEHARRVREVAAAHTGSAPE